MSISSATEKKPISDAKLRANRSNAQRSTGPTSIIGKKRCSSNAKTHGLTARLPPGLDTPQNEQFTRAAFAQLAARNALEWTRINNLLQTRLWEKEILQVERNLFTRAPVSEQGSDERPCAFLQNAASLKTLDALTRQVAHFTRAGHKECLALLSARKKFSGNAASTLVDASNQAEPGNSATPSQENGEAPVIQPGTLADCLANTVIILPDENAAEFEALAKSLWEVLQPANTLEGFIVCDYIMAQWRLDRAQRFKGVLLAKLAVSPADIDCGLAYGFTNDCHSDQGLESLRLYEAALRRRLDQRMSLLDRLRKDGWTDEGVLVTPGSPPPTAAECANASALGSGVAEAARPSIEREVTRTVPPTQAGPV